MDILNTTTNPLSPVLQAPQSGPSNVPPRKTFRVKPVIDKQEMFKRRNFRMRKLLAPKNAVMILNEVAPGVKFQFFPRPENPSQFEARVEVNKEYFEGIGSCKAEAKQNCAEKVIKSMFQTKMLAAVASQTDKNSQAGTSDTNVATEPLDTPGTSAMEVDLDSEEMTIPWAHLASFGLYKLMCYWNEQDSGNPKTVLEAPVKHEALKQMPAKSSADDPLQMLKRLLPEIKYWQLKKKYKGPDVMFRMATMVDGICFKGTDTRRKEAKKKAAISALACRYNIHYVDGLPILV